MDTFGNESTLYQESEAKNKPSPGYNTSDNFQAQSPNFATAPPNVKANYFFSKDPIQTNLNMPYHAQIQETSSFPYISDTQCSPNPPD